MRNLSIKWTVSKARDSYGYNVITLHDENTKYKANGGGYDMVGTVFASWLWANYKQLIINTIKPRSQEFYGFNEYSGACYIDGACGLDCMLAIAKEIGLKVHKLYRKGELTNFIIFPDGWLSVETSV